MGWISSAQQERDHRGLRNICAADGHEGTAGNPLGLSKDGTRVHRSHFADPFDGFYGEEQGDNTRWLLTAQAHEAIRDPLNPDAAEHTVAVYGRADLDRRLGEAQRAGVEVTYRAMDDTNEEIDQP